VLGAQASRSHDSSLQLLAQQAARLEILPIPRENQRQREGYPRQRQHEITHRQRVLVQRVVMAGIQDEVHRVGDIVAHEQRAFPTLDLEAVEEHGEARQRDANHYQRIEAQHGRRDGHPVRSNQTAEAQHRQDVEDVAADHIPDRDVAFAAQAGNHGGRQFGQGSAYRHDG
jgi:hypothetical protein